jgi:predicted RNA-binding protein YlqC (UPF0109 family)
MQALVRFIAQGLGVDDASLALEESAVENEVRLTARVPYSVVQKLDGRDHRTAKALRQVLSAAAAAQDKRFVFTAEAQD